MGLLQQFHIVIKYKNVNTNKLEDILSRNPTTKITSSMNLMWMEPFTCDAYTEGNIDHEDFGEVFQQQLNQFHVEEGDSKVDYHL